MTEWTDDAQQFYERSIGEITNGQDLLTSSGVARPSALYLASNLNDTGTFSRGYVELDYGVGGNVVAVTAHSVCTNLVGICHDPGGTDLGARRTAIHTSCTCASEQHYQYRWDELNRISEARRFDRTNGGDWSFEARQRYRYDGANVRVVKQSFDVSTGDSRVALYVYPGDFERRGLVQDGLAYAPAVDAATSSETQYLVAGARLVLQHDLDVPSTGRPALERRQRVTIPVSDLLHTTSATVDLMSGELLEVSTYYPNGARETLLVDDMLDGMPLEPTGFTGKEADEDVGLVYFGERYLIARVGRWASPDPASIYASGGGEALNAFHYDAGLLLQARDPLGLRPRGMLQQRAYQRGLDTFADHHSENGRSFWEHYWYGGGESVYLNTERTDDIMRHAAYVDAFSSGSLDRAFSVQESIHDDVQTGWEAALSGNEALVSAEQDPTGRAARWTQFFGEHADELRDVAAGERASLSFDSRFVERADGVTMYRAGNIQNDQDWFWALGGFSWYFTGQVTRGEGGAFVVQYQSHLSDRYTWHGDEPTWAAPIIHAFERGAELQRSGGTEPLDVTGPLGFEVRGTSSSQSFELPQDAHFRSPGASRVLDLDRAHAETPSPSAEDLAGEVGAAYGVQ